MSVPPPSPPPPPRNPLGPLPNRRADPAISKPASGKENIRPLPRRFTVGISDTTTATQVATTGPPPPEPSTTSTTATAITTQSNQATAEIGSADDTPAPATQSTTLPPWRLPGAFDNDDEGNEDEDEEKAGASTETVEETNAIVTECAKENESTGEDDSSTGEQITATAPLAEEIVSTTREVDDNTDQETESEQEDALDFTVLGISRRELSFAPVDLDADPELDYGDEFHDLPL